MNKLDICMTVIRVGANYRWAKLTSGVFMLVVFGHLSKTMFSVFYFYNGHMSKFCNHGEFTTMSIVL